MANLTKNERLKLYKKPSTWIIMGIIVALIALTTLFMGIVSRSMFGAANDTTQQWKSYYADQLNYAKSGLKETPDNLSLQTQVDKWTYLLNQEIPPLDWRTDVVEALYTAKGQMLQMQAELASRSTAEPDAQPQPPEAPANTLPSSSETQYVDVEMFVNMTADELRAAIAESEKTAARLEAVLQKNEWKSYVQMQIEDLKAGGTPLKQETQVQIDVLQMYLDMNIVPVSQNSNYGWMNASEDTWKNTELQSIRQNKLTLLRGEDDSGNLITNAARGKLQQANAISMQRLKQNTPPVSELSFLGQINTALSSLSLISIFLMVLAGGILASEFSTGTVKLLLITPNKRAKIYWAKVRILAEITLLSALAVLVVTAGICLCFYGVGGIASMEVLALFGRTVTLPYLLVLALKFVLYLLPVLTYGALALMLSAVTRKSAAAIAVSILLMYGGEIVMSVLALVSYSTGMPVPGMKFLLFANVDLSAYFVTASSGMVGAMFGNGMTQLVDGGMTLGFSVAVLLVYMGCFLWIGRDSFCRRDIK